MRVGVSRVATRGFSSRAFDRRRARKRAQWAPRPRDDDADTFLYPNESLGNTYSVNWGICSYGLVPSNEAYHNLHLRGLVSKSHGALDENKALLVESHEQDVHNNIPVYVAGSADAEVPTGLPSLSENAYQRLDREVRLNLSESDAIFVQDSVIGNSSTLRSFCTSGQSALLLHHMLFSKKLPWELDAKDHPDFDDWFQALPKDLQEDEFEFVEAVQGELVPEPPKFGAIHSLTQYLLHDLQLQDAQSLSLPGNDFSVVNFNSGTIIHAGKAANAQSIRNALSAVASEQMARVGALLVPARNVQDAQDGSSTLEFGGDDTTETTWSVGNTLSAAFQSDIVAAAAAKTHPGDYVETINGKAARVVSSSGRRPIAESPGPSKIVFKNSGKNGRVNQKDLAALLQQRGMRESDAAAFVARVKELKIPIQQTK